MKFFNKYMAVIGLSSVVLLFSFSVASAQAADVTGLIDLIKTIIDSLIPIVVAAALLFFFYGLAKFILASGSGSEVDTQKGKDIMLWGIIALFVMVSVWGLVAFLNASFIDTSGAPNIIKNLIPSNDGA